MERESSSAAGAGRSPWWSALVLAVCLLALGIRIAKAWSERYSLDGDVDITRIMAKHIAEGRDFPVFFYGQPYMGSLEPAFSALMCRLFGASGFAVALGTALVGTLALPLVYLWGRYAGGRRAGLLAMLYCVAGTESFFRFAVAPRGGYMTMLVCGLAAVWLALRVAGLCRRGEEARPWHFWALGLACGLGWWSNQLVAPFLAVAGVVLLANVKRALVRRAALPVALSFLAGSAPWWVWNLFHRWDSLRYFASSAERYPLSTGLKNAWGAFCRLLDYDPASPWDLCCLTVLLALLGGGLLLTVAERRKPAARDTVPARAACFLLMAVMVLLYARSDYGSPPEPRYLLPLFPCLAVALGLACDRLMARRRLLGVAAFVLMLPAQTFRIPRMFERVDGEGALWASVRKDAEEVAALCDGVCAGQWFDRWICFATGERMVLATLPKERCAFYALRAELSGKPAYLNDYRRINEFLAHTGAAASQRRMGPMAFTYGLAPPSPAWRYVEPEAVSALTAADGQDARPVLTDSDVETFWSGEARADRAESLTFALDRPRPICGLRFVSPDDRGIGRLTIEGQTPAGEWVPLAPLSDPTSYFWSGPFPQLEGLQLFHEFRFAAPAGGLARLRVNLCPAERPYTAHLGELLLLESGPAPAGEWPTVDACLKALRSEGVRRFYGPRWLAERLALEPGSGIDVLAPSLLRNSIQDVPEHDSRLPVPVVLNERTGCLMDGRDVPRCRSVLGRLGVRWSETPMGLCTLVVIDKPGQDVDAARAAALCWTEIGPFALGRAPRKEAAHWRFTKALRAGGADAERWLREALALYPNHQAARALLADILAGSGRAAEAQAERAALADRTSPALPARIRYPPGLELVGLTVATNAAAGRDVAVDCFWKCRAGLDPGLYRVVLEFRCGAAKFSTERPLLQGVGASDLGYQPCDEVFVDRLCVPLPPDAPAGAYRVKMVLKDRDGRVKPWTQLKVRTDAAVLPFQLAVKNAG